MTVEKAMTVFGAAITLEAALEYLRKRGWKTTTDGPRIVCEGPADDAGEPILRYLPKSEGFADYPLRIEDLVRTLSVLEERPTAAVAAEMAAGIEPAPIARSDRQLLPSEVVDAVLDDVRRAGGGLVGTERAGQIAATLATYVANAVTEISQHGDPLTVKTAQLQAATIASLLAKQLPAEDDRSGLLVWRVASRILAPARMHLRLSPAELQEFYATARRDSDSGDALFEWMNKRVARGQKPSKGNRRTRR